jgi:hypothetical protein
MAVMPYGYRRAALSGLGGLHADKKVFPRLLRALEGQTEQPLLRKGD